MIIPGGDTFESYESYLEVLRNYTIDLDRYRGLRKDWKATLGEKLGPDYDVLIPTMPNKSNAKYTEWKILFEKIASFLNEEVILIGHSLGGLFLAKYLSEESFSKHILATMIISAPYDSRLPDFSLADFALPSSLKKLESQGGRVFIYHSDDDPVVPIENAQKYKVALPDATLRVLNGRGHFNQEEFPELSADIKTLHG